MEKILIAAVAEDGAIGRDNALLWHISDDMKYFRKTTTGYPVIMGYKTWLSIGRPLPGRKNIVITKSHFDAPAEVLQVADIAEAFTAAEGGNDSGNVGACSSFEGNTERGSGASIVPEKCFVMGGAKTYERTMQYADALYITHVKTAVPSADAYFPEIDLSVWQKVSETPFETDPASGLQYSFAIYRRK